MLNTGLSFSYITVVTALFVGSEAAFTPFLRVEQSISTCTGRLALSSAASQQDEDSFSSSSSKSVTRRRDFLISSAVTGFGLISFSPTAMAGGEDVPAKESGDMTSQLFNEDGSLKKDNALGVTGEATFRRVTESFSNDSSGSSVTVSYGLPAAWKENYVALYPDGVEAKACDEITVFQNAPGKASVVQLEKASLKGVAKTLGITDKRFLSADIISGRKRMAGDVEYFEFDMAVAPATCSSKNDKDNLGIGFCPYDSIVLLSSAVVNDTMFVFSLECGKSEWKRSNSDLKLIRSSFQVDTGSVSS